MPSWERFLLERVRFQEIERQIEHLLAESENFLAAVRVEDMRVNWVYTRSPDGRLDLL